ncbi:hypothetical protein [Aestuariivirga sp.]|uniref:hypothetical protein n=1 Tax=Aestuariivirga sp. TaxID=2650926 RepID=UPI0025C58AF4|nr:hypothetical protein [Aestuariivirga sp.]MCA3555015.1 hypothetical protein [Aestuariivirga sp.]
MSLNLRVFGPVVLVMSLGLAGGAEAGLCDKGNLSKRTACLSKEVAYLTVQHKKTADELAALQAQLPGLLLAGVPVGTVLAWKSNSTVKPEGWEFLDEMDGRWLVGTSDPTKVGEVLNESRGDVSVAFQTGGATGGHNWNFGDTDNKTPEATGLDHAHSGSLTISPDHQKALYPPSMKVRFIIKVK